MAIERHLQGMRTLNANRPLARSVTFEAVIWEVLLYWCIILTTDFGKPNSTFYDASYWSNKYFWTKK